ncbi:sugar transferase [Muricoccus radiodurans]|uniref:sugar transferase n=1 Tax=Muricoccus radiodurans TaxID=2231721 RepID=UPI003CF0D10C
MLDGTTPLHSPGHEWHPAEFRPPVGTVLIPVKRITDIVGASMLLVLLAPLMALVSAMLLATGGGVLYAHPRIGLGGRTFGCLKFRTMVRDGDAVLARHLRENPAATAEWAARRKLVKDPRVTRLGAFLRAYSVDELPQLVNVLVGDMSLVGPRPVVRAELDEHYGAAGRAAYMMTRPGMTGPWQIQGRSNTDYSQRVALDVNYVDQWSFRGDLVILTRTAPAVLSRRGAV